jgi:putative oxidoreductase
MKLGIPIESPHAEARPSYWPPRLAELLVPVGRSFYSLVFLFPALGYFIGNGSFSQTTGLSLHPAVELSFAVTMLLCGSSIAAGYFARVGAGLAVVLLLPVTLWLHPFWSLNEAPARQIAEALFLRNASIMGGALLIVYFGAGPISADDRAFLRD